MHSKNVVHLDIKAENVMINDFQCTKLGSFGLATNKKIKNLTFFRGTKQYMAPEIWGTKSYDGRMADIFSFGVLIFLIVVGKFPFQRAHRKDKNYHYFHSKIGYLYFSLSDFGISTELKELLLKIFDKNPANRPTLDEIKKDPWMQKKYDHNQTRRKIYFYGEMEDGNKIERTDTIKDKIDKQESVKCVDIRTDSHLTSLLDPSHNPETPGYNL